MKTYTEISFFLINTLLLYPFLSPYSQTDVRMDGQTDRETNTLTSRGLEELFLQLSCCVSFWFWREIGSFFVVAGKFYYDRKKKVLVICLADCAVVSVFGSGDYNRKKKSYSRPSGRLCCCVSFGSGGK